MTVCLQRRLATESQLRLLRVQLEPHRLFNTVANLRSLVKEDLQQTERMIDQLITYLRGRERHQARIRAQGGPHVVAQSLRRWAWSKAKPLEASPRPLRFRLPSQVVVEPSVQRVCW